MDGRIGGLEIFYLRRHVLLLSQGRTNIKRAGSTSGGVKLHNRSFLSRQVGSKPMSQTGYTSAD